uniref:Nudix hydrolase domain-containing protein n=1 Tax=Arundo donax TaxID=35708 RepID=A0A0A9EQM7_ARUDO
MSSKPDKVAAARKGRLRQRYDNEYRLVAGCVPYRVKKDDEGNPCSSLGDDPAEVEVLMISTPNRTDMVFPKGGWEDDEDVYQAAGREAMEEAGVKGIINVIHAFPSPCCQFNCSVSWHSVTLFVIPGYEF